MEVADLHVLHDIRNDDGSGNVVSDISKRKASGFGLQWLISGRYFITETETCQGHLCSATDVVFF